jgi:integrase
VLNSPASELASRGVTHQSKPKAALTELRIEKLKATGKTFYVQDGAQPGLSVRVSAGGVKSFCFTKFKNGRFTQITLGRAGALRLDDARKAAQRLHGEIASGVDVGAKRKAARTDPMIRGLTMEEAFDRFMNAKQRRPNTVSDYGFQWRLHVPASIKRKPVSDVTAADIEDIKRKAGKQHRTANKTIALLSAIMAKSGRWADNPAREVSRHHEQPRTRRLSVDELQRVWSACGLLEGDWGDFFRLLVLTGARRAAFQAMRWQDLNLDAGVWMVPVQWVKSKREMAIPLSSEAVRILRERREQSNSESNPIGRSEGRPSLDGLWVWPSSDSATGHTVNPEKPFRRLLKAAGIHERASLHDIRRTLGSRLAMDGVAGATISKVLGHVSPGSLRHYAHLDVTAGADAIDRLFADVVKPSKGE